MKKHALIVSAVTFSLLLSSTAAVAAPKVEGDVEDALDIVENQPEASVSSIETLEKNDVGIIAQTDSGTAVIPLSASNQEGIAFETELGTVELPLPTEAGGDATILSDNTVLYVDGSVPTTAQMVDNDSVRIQTITQNADSPHSFEYAFPSGWSVGVLADGTAWAASDINDEEAPVVALAAPWAFDAAGKAVPTHYEARGNAIVQVLDPDDSVTYPIVADPTYSLGKGIYVHFNRAETASIASGGWMATGYVAVCIAAGAATGQVWAPAVLGAACLAVSGTVIYNAGVAQNSSPKKCLYINLRPNARVGTYKDSRCK